MLKRTLGVALALAIGASESPGQTNVPVVQPQPATTTRLEDIAELSPGDAQRIRDAYANRPPTNPGRRRAPVDPLARPDLVPRRSLPMEPPTSSPVGRAPGDFTFYRTHRSTDAETSDLCSQNACEPSVAANGRVSWVTGNWFAGASGDYVNNYTFVNPATNFSQANGNFCCDQVLQYDRTRGAMFWYLQYSPPNAGASNIVRLAVSVGQFNQENNNWFIYDISPALFGYANGVQFDFPDMALGANNLYITTNIVNGPDGAICMRLSLDDLAAANSVSVFNTPTSLPNLRCTQGAGTTIWFGTQVDTNTLRIYSWPESQGSASSVDRDVDAWFQGSSAPDPNGTDWIARDFNDILSAYVSVNRIVFLWGSAQGGGFPFPNIRIARFDTSNRNLVDQGQIWSASVAWAYPNVHPNDRGDLGGVFAFGGGGFFPSVAAVIADSFGGSQTGPYEGFTLVSGTGSPAVNRWGDYFTARRGEPFGNTWLAAGWIVSSTEPGSPTQPWSAWFGREQDQPPASRTIVVNLNYTDPWEEGSVAHPYDSVFEGHYATVAGDVVQVQSGSYDETVTLDRACTVQASGGTVVVGQ